MGLGLASDIGNPSWGSSPSFDILQPGVQIWNQTSKILFFLQLFSQRMTVSAVFEWIKKFWLCQSFHKIWAFTSSPNGLCIGKIYIVVFLDTQATILCI
jgi:hypothetical protein